MSKFIKGMDLSTLLELERCGAKYYEDGKEKDILDIMKEHDVDTIRLRLWNDPKSEERCASVNRLNRRFRGQIHKVKHNLAAHQIYREVSNTGSRKHFRKYNRHDNHNKQRV